MILTRLYPDDSDKLVGAAFILTMLSDPINSVVTPFLQEATGSVQVPLLVAVGVCVLSGAAGWWLVGRIDTK